MSQTLATLLARAENVRAKDFNNNEAKLAEKILSGLGTLPSIVASANFTTLGGAAAEAITIAGLLSTDIAIVTVRVIGATPRIVTKAVTTANTLTVTFAGDPSTDHVISYLVLRPAA